MSNLLASRLADELWMLAVSFLPIRNVIPHLPCVSKYFGEVVIWGPTSGALMWREMSTSPEGALEAHWGLDARVFKRWSGERNPSQTALMRACWKGAPLAHVSNLIVGGGNVALRAVDGIGLTPMHGASDCGHEGMVRMLLEANADPNVASCFGFGFTPLMKASVRGHLAVVATLVAEGARINHADFNGWTALMLASRENHVDVVRLLVANGANVNLRCLDGRNALDIARLCENHDIVAVLESAMSEQ